MDENFPLLPSVRNDVPAHPSLRGTKQSSEKQCIIVLSGLLRKLAMTSDSKRHFRLFDFYY